MTAQKRVLVALNEHALVQADLIQGLGHYAMLHPHLTLHVHLFLTDPASDRRLLRRMVRHLRPDGVLASVFWQVGNLPLPAGTKLVNLADFPRPDCPTVMNDQELAGRMAAEHLLEQGLSHYAFAAVSGGDYGAACRWRGFRTRLREAGHDALLFDEFVTRKHETSITDEALLAWVMRLPKPVGIHTHVLSWAARIAWSCREAGLRLPGDAALIGGQDNPALAAAWGPMISGIEFDRAKVGYEGLRLLDRLMHGRSAPTAPILIPPKRLVLRASSDFKGSKDPEVARIRQWIRDNAHRPLTVKDLMAHTSLSRRTLERRFAAQTGRGLHEEIRTLRMERAQALLRETALPLTQVAARSGYANYVTFTLAFRRSTGMTASAFRRRAALASGQDDTR